MQIRELHSRRAVHEHGHAYVYKVYRCFYKHINSRTYILATLLCRQGLHDTAIAKLSRYQTGWSFLASDPTARRGIKIPTAQKEDEEQTCIGDHRLRGPVLLPLREGKFLKSKWFDRQNHQSRALFCDAQGPLCCFCFSSREIHYLASASVGDRSSLFALRYLILQAPPKKAIHRSTDGTRPSRRYSA